MAANRFVQEGFRQSALEQDRLLRLSLPQVQAYFRDHLQRHGTDVTRNDREPQGDGDQSRVSSAQAQFYRDMFACGGDINHHGELQLRRISEFAKHCLAGNVTEVQRLLRNASSEEGPPTPALLQLLETRETSLRLSPLLLLVSMGKNLANPGVTDGQIRVAKLLLQYGARPNARDVSGKTVCHYGMGVMASDMTLQVASLCSQAHQSSHLFGHQVELHGLKAAHLNGATGWCHGYHVDTGRRSVYLTATHTTVAIKPKNIKLVDENSNGGAPRTKLCDIPDRLGAVCLLEVIQGDRVDVAEILLSEHEADLDMEDCDGVSPRSLSHKTALMSKVAAMVNKEAGARGKQDQKANLRTCCNCGVVESTRKKLLVCSTCSAVWYCSRECQLQHWKQGGHKKVCKDLAAAKSVAIVLEKPKKGGMYTSTFDISASHTKRGTATLAQKERRGYRKPSTVAVDEKFDLKVQGNSPATPLMVYDKSRECNFSVYPGDRGFQELLEAVQAEPTWQGRKTFVTASFDADGNCTVYPGLTSVKKW